MGELKEYLKSAREKKGLTLRDIADRTRISYTFLEAIEDENFTVIPGEVFVTGFLRTYARELGVEEKEVVALYRKMTAPSAEGDGEDKAGSEPPARSRPTMTPLHYILAAGLALGAILVVISLVATGSDPPSTTASPPKTTAAVPVPGPADEAFTAASTAADPKQDIVASAQPETGARDAAAPLVLQMKAVEDCWYSYRADGGERTSGMLKKGEVLALEAADRILLNLGNAGGVKVLFNGKTVGPFGPRGAVRNDILFTASAPGILLTPDRSIPDAGPGPHPAPAGR